MALFHIDEEKCRRDGICAMTCPASLVRWEAPETFPVPLAGKEGHCIACGHCASVCPHGALTLEKTDPGAFEPILPELEVSAEQAAQFMKSRRSVRNFRPEPVSKKTLGKILDVTRWAPSGHNKQPVRWTILSTREAVESFLEHVVDWMREQARAGTETAKTLNLGGAARAWEKGRDVIARGAPNLVLAHAPKRGVTPDVDAVIAASWLELAAHAHDVGVCWAGYVMFAFREHPALGVHLGIPDDHAVQAAMMLGRARFRHQSIPPRKPAEVNFL